MHARLAILGLALASCYAGLGAAPDPSGVREEIVHEPDDDELGCLDEEDVRYEAPAEVLEIDGIDCDAAETYCFRLASDLRDVAAEHDPSVALARSTEAFDADDPVRGRAFADLAVTGTRAYAAFAADPPQGEGPAIERAYDVVWALRGPARYRAAARPELGWIAVSPEDDPPDRPVNVVGSAFPMGDLTVDVPLDGGSLSVRTRIVVASTLPVAEPVVPDLLTGSVPDPSFAIPPRGDVMLFVHGHGSLAEEGGPLIGALLDEHRARGADVTIIAMDLPSNGYADRIDPDDVGNVLDFHDAFLRALGDAIGSDRIAAVMGGSLGGNLAMRMAEQGAGWPRRAIAWSPASIDYSWSHAKLFAGEGEFHDIVKHEAVRLTWDASRAEEDPSSREDYFTAGLLSVRNQAGYWYRPGFAPCGERLIHAGLLFRAEVYDERYRRWHYRTAYEQLVFSHIDPEEDDVRPFQRITVPFLLMAGEEDNAMPIATYSFVQRLTPHLTMPGRTILLRQTGHAIHRERPRTAAAQIAAFLFDE